MSAQLARRSIASDLQTPPERSPPLFHLIFYLTDRLLKRIPNMQDADRRYRLVIQNGEQNLEKSIR
ncbi:MAG: hypothetical protein HC860_12935 [Alkalinema sp. RU_4_3]|nr:hypothetical protein [Alkalinema sp. RU_4_3]